jgi:uncharacterized glyoxalase superfamily protein PhnB
MHRAGIRCVFAFAMLLLAAPLGAQSPAPTCKEGKAVKILRNTPIAIVEAIEPLLPFWTERLGFTQKVEVPHGDKLGFVILQRDDQQVMLQTRASLGEDIAVLAPLLEKRTILQYMDVDSLDALLAGLGDWKLLLPPRTTFYGAREVAVQDPAGFLLVFAEHKPQP